jgi:hypothetical protein
MCAIGAAGESARDREADDVRFDEGRIVGEELADALANCATGEFLLAEARCVHIGFPLTGALVARRDVTPLEQAFFGEPDAGRHDCGAGERGIGDQPGMQLTDGGAAVHPEESHDIGLAWAKQGGDGRQNG